MQLHSGHSFSFLANPSSVGDWYSSSVNLSRLLCLPPLPCAVPQWGEGSVARHELMTKFSKLLISIQWHNAVTDTFFMHLPFLTQELSIRLMCHWMSRSYHHEVEQKVALRLSHRAKRGRMFFFSPYKSRKWHENSTVCLSNRPFLDSSFPFRVPSGIVPSRHCAHHSRHSNPRKCVLGVNEPLNVEFS